MFDFLSKLLTPQLAPRRQHTQLTADQQQAVDELRAAGFAVVIFTPEEADDLANPRELEDHLVSEGKGYLDDCANLLHMWP